MIDSIPCNPLNAHECDVNTPAPACCLLLSFRRHSKTCCLTKLLGLALTGAKQLKTGWVWRSRCFETNHRQTDLSIRAVLSRWLLPGQKTEQSCPALHHSSTWQRPRRLPPRSPSSLPRSCCSDRPLAEQPCKPRRADPFVSGAPWPWPQLQLLPPPQTALAAGAASWPWPPRLRRPLRHHELAEPHLRQPRAIVKGIHFPAALGQTFHGVYVRRHLQWISPTQHESQTVFNMLQCFCTWTSKESVRKMMLPSQAGKGIFFSRSEDWKPSSSLHGLSSLFCCCCCLFPCGPDLLSKGLGLLLAGSVLFGESAFPSLLTHESAFPCRFSPPRCSPRQNHDRSQTKKKKQRAPPHELSVLVDLPTPLTAGHVPAETWERKPSHSDKRSKTEHSEKKPGNSGHLSVSEPFLRAWTVSRK